MYLSEGKLIDMLGLVVGTFKCLLLSSVGDTCWVRVAVCCDAANKMSRTLLFVTIEAKALEYSKLALQFLEFSGITKIIVLMIPGT